MVIFHGCVSLPEGTQLIGQALNFLPSGETDQKNQLSRVTHPKPHETMAYPHLPHDCHMNGSPSPQKNTTKPTRGLSTKPEPASFELSNSKRVNIRHVGLSEHRCIIIVPINIAINWGYTPFSDTSMMVYTSYTHTNIPCCIAIILLYVYIYICIYITCICIYMYIYVYIYYMYMYIYIYILCISHASD